MTQQPQPQQPPPTVEHLIDQVLIRIATQRIKLKEGKLRGN